MTTQPHDQIIPRFYLLELVEHGLGPVGLGHVGEAVEVDALDGRDRRDSVAWKRRTNTESVESGPKSTCCPCHLQWNEYKVPSDFR